jgi:chromate transport protein ChrA
MIQDIGYYVSPVELATAFAIFVLLAAALGYRRKAHGSIYWTLAIVKAIIAFLFWWFLSMSLFLIIITYTIFPLEEKLLLYSITDIAVYIGLCVLLVLIEVRPRRSKGKSINNIDL